MTDVAIEHFICKYHVPQEKANPANLKKKLDTVVNNLLDRECERIFPNILQNNNTLFFIKNLKIDFALNIDQMSDRAIARLWAAKIGTAIKRNIQHTDGIITFKKKSLYLAHFICDLLNGTAWQKWYYHSLHHFKNLNHRTILMKILDQHKESSEDILLQIKEKRLLNQLVNQLNEDDARVICDDYLAQPTKQENKPYRELIPQLLTLINENSLKLEREKWESYKNYLIIYFHALKKSPGLQKVTSLRQAVKFAFLLKELITSGNIREFLNIAQQGKKTGSPGSAALSAMIGEILRSEGKKALLEIARAVEKETEALSQNKISTLYGGIFIFTRLLVETGFYSILESSSFPQQKNLPRTHAFLFFLAQKILGQEEPDSRTSDSGLYVFAGFKNPPTPYLLEHFIQSVTPEMNQTFFQSLLDTFPRTSQLLHADLSTDQDHMDFPTLLDITVEIIYKLLANRLKRFENSSPGYIFKNFIHRWSEITPGGEIIQVKMSPKPLDVVLRLSGLLEDTGRIPWLEHRNVSFSLDGE